MVRNLGFYACIERKEKSDFYYVLGHFSPKKLGKMAT